MQTQPGTARTPTARSLTAHGRTARRLTARTRTRAALPGLLVTLVLIVLGVGALPAAAATTPPGGAWVRAAHLIPGLGAMRISVVASGGGSAAQRVLVERAGYGDATEHVRVAPGRYTVQVRPAGSAVGSAPLLSAPFTATAGRSSTLAGLGTLTAPRLAVLSDDLTPAPAGQARVRVLPAAGSAARVTVRADQGPTIASDAAFGVPTEYATVPQGAWRLQVSSGSGARAASTVAVSGGSVYTLLVLDGPGGALQVAALQDAAGLSMTPVGGAATGAGGTATPPVDDASGLDLSGATGLLPVAALLAAGLLATAARPAR